MKFIDVDLLQLQDLSKQKKIYCFGCSKVFVKFADTYLTPELLNSIVCFIDNDINKVGGDFLYKNFRWKICDIRLLKDLTDSIVIVTSMNAQAVLEITEQLKTKYIDDSNICISALLLTQYGMNDDFILKPESSIQIPKIIHSFWFSGDAKPKEYQQCIDSWKKYCPDYEIIEWNSNNYDVSKNKYMKQAYEKKSWAFVSDYARLDVVHQYGGIYFDMDVEVLKNIDGLLGYDGFFSFDNYNYIDLGSGFGAKKGYPFLKELLDVYDSIDFDGDLEKTDWNKTIPQPERLINNFVKFGFKRNDKSQLINNIAFLSPVYMKIIGDKNHELRFFTGKEFVVHWHNAGWVSREMLIGRENRNKILMKLKEMYNIE